MKTIEISAIVIPEDRQRKESKGTKDLIELKKSILTKGLLHPPVLSFANDIPTLVAGERRLLSMQELHVDGLEFSHDQQVVPKDHIPYITIGDLSPADLAETELEENLLRMNLSWIEESEAKVKIHELRKLANPDQTLIETAKEIQAISGTEGSIKHDAVQIGRMQTVVAHMNSPEVRGAKSLNAAYSIVLDRQKAKLEYELRGLIKTPSAHNCILGDCLTIMKDMPKGQFNAIISDPPYGINAHLQKKDVKHLYDDTPQNALAIYQGILRYGFHLLKPKGTLFLFCDVEHFVTIRTFAEQQAFSTWRTPIIWHKGPEGFAPWGINGFARTYECLLFAVKGENSLVLNGGPDVKLIKRNTKEITRHGAEKPPEVFRWLLELSVRRGDSVLDPCCGAGAIFPASAGLGLSITGIELNPQYHTEASARLLVSDEEKAPESNVVHKKTLAEIESKLGIAP